MSERRSRFKLLVVGVGGQGALTAARFLGDAALAAGQEVAVAQMHGMSQRGGSVECSVLIGPGQGSTIGDGEANAVLGLEPLEALRARPKMSERTCVVVNVGKIVPFHLSHRGVAYPPVEGILADIRKVAPRVHTVDGPSLVKDTGVARTLNIVMLGALSGIGILPFDGEVLWGAVERRIPPRFLEPNRLAFDLGRRAVAGTPA